MTQRDVSERLGVTQQTYARLEANPASASIERLYKVFTVLGIEMVLSAGSYSPMGTSAREPTVENNSPARREKW